MFETSRRAALGLALGAAAAAQLSSDPASAAAARKAGPACKPRQAWLPGVENQRTSDLGDGTFLNPVLAGDHPDPSVLKHADTYYKVSSSFHYYPGLIIWKSQDLVNWMPVGPALRKPIGSIFAPDLVEHDGRFYIYFPVANFAASSALPPAQKPKRPILATFVVHADSMDGPWSDPVDMGIYDGIDPGHVIGEDGKRYLFLDAGKLVPITDDGLKRAGPTEKVYEGWPIPDDYIVEGLAPESPKLIKKDGWFYMFSAQGGTAGPPTSHMVVVARSRSVRGPWINCPHNPIVHTASIDEPWWSRGHATPVQGPKGDWWMIYHGYENGYRTLGRQMLLEPFVWDADGWPVAKGGDLGSAIRKPRGGKALPHNMPHSDDFATDRFGVNLAAFMPGENYAARMNLSDGALVVAGEGTRLTESSPLLMDVGDHSYALSVEVELNGAVEAGLVVYYDQKYHCATGTDGKRLHAFKMGQEPYGVPRMAAGAKLFLKVENRRNVATFYKSEDGKAWAKFVSFEVSCYNHNIADGFLSLRPGLYATGKGEAKFRNMKYEVLT